MLLYVYIFNNLFIYFADSFQFIFSYDSVINSDIFMN